MLRAVTATGEGESTYFLAVESVGQPVRQESGRDWLTFNGRTFCEPVGIPFTVAHSAEPAESEALLAMLRAPSARVQASGHFVVNVDAGGVGSYFEACRLKPVEILDPVARAAEKQASRDADAARLAAGEITPAELARENSFFGSLDLSGFRIAAIGKTPIEDVR